MCPPQHLEVDPIQSHLFQPREEVPPPAVVLGQGRLARLGREQPSVRVNARQHFNPLPNPNLQLVSERRLSPRLERLRSINGTSVDALLDLGEFRRTAACQPENFSGTQSREYGQSSDDTLSKIQHRKECPHLLYIHPPRRSARC